MSRLRCLRHMQELSTGGTPSKILRSGSGAPVQRSSEVPDQAPSDEVIVLTTLACVHVQLWHTRPEIAKFATYTERLKGLYIDSHATLERTGCGPCFPRVRCSEQQVRALTEVSEAATEADPRRNRCCGKQV